MTDVLGIDPGNTESAWALIDADTCWPAYIGKAPNSVVRDVLHGSDATVVAVEMVASYGMTVGFEVFETCVEIGRFVEIAPAAQLTYRRDIKLHHCGSVRANDANITQALVDRFAPGAPNRGKGTKKAPGWFHGFHSDIWQAFALAVYIADAMSGTRVGAVEQSPVGWRQLELELGATS